MRNTRRNMLMRRGSYDLKSVDTTPCLDPLRSTRLHPPYYGLPPLDCISTSTLIRPESRKELAARISDREQELQSMRAALNASAPINKLPTELFVQILMHLQNARGDPVWTNVLRVCRHWFVVGSTAGTLWRKLKVREKTNLLRTGLARSRSADLNIEASYHSPHSLPEISALLVPHVHRLCSLDLSVIPASCLPTFADFMGNDMPALRSLRASTASGDFSEPVLALPTSRFPQMQALTLSGFQIFNDLEIASQLRKVDISSCSGQHPALRSTTLLDAVLQMQHVQSLTLRDVLTCDSDVHGARTVSATNRATLPQLKKIHIQTDGPLVKAMLSTIIIPPTATASFVSIFDVDHWQRDTPYLRTIVPEDHSCLPILSEILSVSVVSAIETHFLEGYTTPDPGTFPRRGNPDIEFRVDVPDDLADPMDGTVPLFMLVDLVDIFHAAPLESLYFEITAEVAADTEWGDILRPFSSLCTLQIAVLNDDSNAPRMAAVFSALDPGETPAAAVHADHAHERSRGDRDAAVVCPDLECLHLSGLSTPDPELLLEAVTTCLENRRRALGRWVGRMEEIALGVMGHRGRAHFLSTKTAFEVSLAQWADTVTYECDDRWYR